MSHEFDKTLAFTTFIVFDYIKSSLKAGKKEPFWMAFTDAGRGKRK